SFTSVNVSPAGVPRTNAAAFSTAAVGVATPWDPHTNDIVKALALSAAGTTMYLGGDFTKLNGTTATRTPPAAVDTTLGNVTGWNPSPDGNTVNAIAVSGSNVYAGGDFTKI